MTDQKLSLTIDGHEVTCTQGSTVYEAAKRAGIHIPTFCHHDKLKPVGACRMCLVEIEGARGLQTSCTTPARAGMAVGVHSSPAAVKARRANIEFLLTNHPLDCPVCDKGGECPLQDQALMDGPGQSRYIEEKRHKNKRYPLSELIVLDQERCVLCWRCIRFLDEWADEHELDLFGRGATTRIDTFPGHPLSSKWQGNTIDICPVGALTSRVFRFEARVWELTNTPSVCPLCPVGCNITLGVKNNQIRRITPRENLHVNETWICDKGRFAHGFVDHGDRLTTPLIRRDGELQRATWDEALDLIARRLSQILQEHGPQAIAGLGSTRVTNEANYLFQRFMRTAIGSNNIDHLHRVPVGAVPLNSLPDLERRDAFLLLGFDPSTEAPLVELWIKKAILRHGARAVTVHPHRIELSRYGGPHLGYRPGTEVGVLNSLCRALLDTGLEGKTLRVTNLEDMRTWLRDYGPQQVERLTGTSAQALRESAGVLSDARRPVILYGPAWIRRASTLKATDAQGGALARPILDGMANLALLLGGIDPGMVVEDNNSLGALDMGVVPDLFPGRQPFGDSRIRNRLAGFWGGRLSPVEGIGFEAMMDVAQAGSLKALWIMGSDPASDSHVGGEALGRIPFLVAQDLFMTDTTAQAEVVLPAASFAEVDGCFTNLTGRLQPIRAGKRPPGLAQPDWWIVTEVARRMIGAKQRKSWAFASASEVLAEITKVVPNYRGVDCASIGPEGWQPPAPPATPRRSFSRVEMQMTPGDPGYPLVLLTGQLLYDRGTLQRRSERIQGLVPEAFVAIHPIDAARLDLAEGDDVTIVSKVGRLGLTVRINAEISPGVVFAPHNLSIAPLSVLYDDPSAPLHVRLVK